MVGGHDHAGNSAGGGEKKFVLSGMLSEVHKNRVEKEKSKMRSPRQENYFIWGFRESSTKYPVRTKP